MRGQVEVEHKESYETLGKCVKVAGIWDVCAHYHHILPSCVYASCNYGVLLLKYILPFTCAKQELPAPALYLNI